MWIRPRALTTVVLLISPLVHAQPPAGPRPQFEVASIKRNPDCGNRRNGDGPPNPGRISLFCSSVVDMIQSSYVRWGSGPNPKSNLKILGWPEWADSELFDIKAKADGNAAPDQMYGPMLQTLLESRFNLKLHRETRELPVYALTVAKGGMKIAPIRQGSCTAFDVNHMPIPPPGETARPVNLCGRQSSGRAGANMTLDVYGMTLTQLAEGPLSSRLDRPVIDRTGVAEKFDVHLEFAPAQMGADLPSTAPETTGPSIFSALQQLGLKLEPAKGPVQVIVVDHIERPSEN